MDLSEYVLEPLRKDEEFILYRGQHKNQVDAPSVLLRAPVSTRPPPESLKRMEHEYSLRAELDLSWAVRPLALSQLNGQMMLVLENPGGEPLDRLIQGPMEMTQFLRFAVGLATALSRLHKRGLIHKDIKPPNVLVNSATGEVWLMGFGIASRLPREHQWPEPPEFIAGTLPYMAPEQTGRMNRSIDSRSDLYAFGVTLYEMLTGRLPFTASDPMEWVHCHIARQPAPPSERLKNVPGSVSAIIMKLLAKTAEERYQTAVGAESDLRRCLAEWETQRRVDEFALGEHDTLDRLLIPEKLYGRESEIEALVAAFDRVVAGARPELVLVSGYSGIGKSSVVNELHKRLVPPRGLFASGKFDQYKRDIPYATLAQAFQTLLRPLLTKNETELGKWRDALQDALGPNAKLIVNLVPELQLIIGEPPPVADLPPQDAQRRFQFVFRRFIGVFARPEHPLALFLDDLQWLDSATLDLIEDLLTQSDVPHLMLIGAYRDNEVNSSHPLTRKLDAMRKAGAPVQAIVLAPLTRADVAVLVTDSFHPEPERAAALAELIHEKTAGNPFFVIQFISALVEEDLLTFDYDQGQWSWDLNTIRAKGYTDNVADLMVGKLKRLPIETQQALQLLACLGNRAEFALLEMVSQQSSDEMHARFWEATRTGLVFRSGNAYWFLHDRVQEAAYSLIPQDSRANAHLRIGRLIAAATPPDKLEERIFEIVNQLNRGLPLVTSDAERLQIAELNLIAARRARASTAYKSTLVHLAAGEALLSEEHWETHHDLRFPLALHRAECEFLTGEFLAADERLSRLRLRAIGSADLAAVACLRIALYTTDRIDRAVEVGVEQLRTFGIEWSAHPTEEEVRAEYDELRQRVGERPIETLVDLASMRDADFLALIEVLLAILPAALFTERKIHDLAVLRMANLSLEHGYCDASPLAFGQLSMVIGPRFGHYRDGFRFGHLGVALAEREDLARFRGKVYCVVGYHVLPWTQPIQAASSMIQRALDLAQETGDLLFVAHCQTHLISLGLASGARLDELEVEAERYLQATRQLRFSLVIDTMTTKLALIRTLRGLTPQFGYLDDVHVDELRMEHHLSGNPMLVIAASWHWIRKMQARYLAGDYAAAADALSKAQPLGGDPFSQHFEAAEFWFYGALSHAASWDSAPPDEKQRHSEALKAHQEQLDIWARNCPENFENRATLVSAEIARIQGRELEAEHLYEQAVRSAHENGFVHNEAIANELAAHFYAARGLEKIAHAYLQDARYGYLRWGADGKVRQLDQLYPHLRVPSPTSTIGAPVEHLDLATVIKVSQAVSCEIVLEKLIDTLMRTAIEHAGAERGLLILPRGVEQRIQAEATTSGDTVIVRVRDVSAAGAALPESIVHYVVRTRESVILDDASAQNSFSADTYIRQHRARSVLCLPLINQARLIGVLYLENNLTPHVFNPTRIAVLELLASQAAISLENASLYSAKKAAEELASSHVEVMMRSLDVLAKEPAPEKYIAEILRTIGQHLRAHRVMLWLREQNDDSLRLHTVILNDKPIVTDETDHPFVRTSSSWKQIPFLTGMLATKSTAVCEDVEDDSRLTSGWRKYLTSRKTRRLVSVPMFLAGEFRGFISIHHSEAGTYRPDETELAQSLAQHVVMAVHGQQVAEQERQAAILKERARLARDVHDTLAQGFTGVILQMEAAEEALFDENPDAAVRRVRRAREIARESLGEARRSVHALRPQALDKSGFAEALQSMLKNTTAGTSLRTSFCSEGEPMVLPANVEETLLRIGQEALSNALKHAHPTEFHIRLCFKSDAVRLEFFDNGKGFVVGQTNGGIGLLGMKERAEQIGATLTISSGPGKGTKVIAVSPNKVETASS